MSSAINKFSEEEISLLLVKARHFNIENHITGVLLYIDGDFLQVLEGKKKDIEQLFEKIKRDKRHKGIIVVYEGSKTQRQFSNWSMGFHSTSYEMLRNLVGFEEINKKDLLNIEDKTAVSFLETFITTHKEKVTFW